MITPRIPRYAGWSLVVIAAPFAFACAGAESDSGCPCARSTDATRPSVSKSLQPIAAIADDGPSSEDAGAADETGEVETQLANLSEDPAFDRMIAATGLGASVPRAEALADVALQMLEAERVLLRSHKSGLSAEKVLQRAAALAQAEHDKKSLERLATAARAYGKRELAEQLRAAVALAGSSRGLADAVAGASPEERQVLSAFDAQLAEARFLNDALLLDTLLQYLEHAPLKDGQKQRVRRQIAEERKSIGTSGSDPASDQLMQLAGETRGVRPLWSAKISGMKFYRQLQTQWCWAAATKTVVYQTKKRKKSQCKMASRFIAQKSNRDYCCGSNAGKSMCNQPFTLETTLGAYGALKQKITGPPRNMDTLVRSEIRNGRPVAIRIGWKTGGGHFVVIYGVVKYPGYGAYSEPVTYYVYDPGSSSKSRRFRKLTKTGIVRAYAARGRWTHTYFTK